VIEVDLRMLDPADFRFEAGQWVCVPFGPKNVRAWSIASSPTRRGTITLAVDVTPGGIGSQWLRGLRTGDPVRFKGPTGGFVFNRADSRRALFVAEEIGIVPVRSILLHLYETGYGRANGLLFWARDPSWLLYDAEFRSACPALPVVFVFPHPARGARRGDAGGGRCRRPSDPAWPPGGLCLRRRRDDPAGAGRAGQEGHGPQERQMGEVLVTAPVNP
jgi:ferredoxin-NADP reductase